MTVFFCDRVQGKNDPGKDDFLPWDNLQEAPATGVFEMRVLLDRWPLLEFDLTKVESVVPVHSDPDTVISIFPLKRQVPAVRVGGAKGSLEGGRRGVVGVRVRCKLGHRGYRSGRVPPISSEWSKVRVGAVTVRVSKKNKVNVDRFRSGLGALQHSKKK